MFVFVHAFVCEYMCMCVVSEMERFLFYLGGCCKYWCEWSISVCTSESYNVCVCVHVSVCMCTCMPYIAIYIGLILCIQVLV